MPRLVLLLLPAALLACKDKGDAADSGAVEDDDSGYTSVETGQVTDTGTGTTGDTGGTDSGGTDGGGTDSGDTGSVESVAVTGLSAWPDSLTVAPGDAYTLRTVATWDDGSVGDVVATWESADPAVATVDTEGTVTAVAAGSVALSGSYGELSTSVDLVVDDSGAVTITVVDAATGSPLPGARVRLGLERSEDGEGTTGADGTITVAWTEPGPFMVSAFDFERVPVTIIGAVGRQLTIPLRDEALVEPALTSMAGPVDLSGIPSGGTGDHKVGLAMLSLQDGPLLLHPDRLLGPAKEVSLYGLEAAIPGNVYLRDASEEYALLAGDGSARLWTLGAPLPISEMTKGLSGATDALGLLLDHLDDVAWGFSDDVTVAIDADLMVELAPSLPADQRWTVDIGPLPVGFGGTESALVLVGEELGDAGLTPYGVGLGRSEVEVFGAAAPFAGTGTPRAAVLAQVGGIGAGTGYGIVAAHGPLLAEGVTTLPLLPRVPALHAFDPATHAFEIENDDRMRWVHALIRGGSEGDLREVVMDGGVVTGTLPDLAGLFPWGRTTWEIVAVEPTGGTFHDHLRDGWPSDAALASDAWTSGMLTAEP